MASNRAERMGGRSGLAGAIDSLRYHEASRQGFGLILLLVCAWFTVAAGEARSGLRNLPLGLRAF